MAESDSSRTLEIAHVLFMDIVGYSKLPIDEQEHVLRQLNELVRSTEAFAPVQSSDKLIRLPTGDGMALVFFGDAEAPVRGALELGHSLRALSGLPLRMGIHTGPVYRVADINTNRNVAGGGVNIAQRVMDCGDAGHILVSAAEAEIIGQVTAWSGALHDLGEAEVKHGVKVHLYNLYTQEAGNPALPQKLRAANMAAAAARSKARKRRVSLAAVAAGVAATLVVAGLLYSRKANALSPTDTVVLADFANSTGDAVFDDTLKQALSVELAQSPFLNILSDQKMRDTLKLMARPPGERLTPEVAKDLCQRTGGAAVLDGSIASLGSQYVLGFKAVSCRTGDTLAEEQERATAKEQVLAAMDKAAAKLRAKLGESLSTVQKFDTPLAQATTPSLEALQALSLGRNTLQQKGEAEAIPFYKRAVELDPNFASAYLGLGICYASLGETGLATENLQRAYALRDRVSERERFHISSIYYGSVTGDLEKANQTYELWAQAYPRDYVPPGNLASNYASLGQYDKAVAATLEALRLNPDSSTAYGNLVAYYAFLNRLDEARATYQQAIARKPENPYLSAMLYGIAFLQGDTQEMQRQVALTAGKPGAEDILFSFHSDTEAFSGHLRKGRDFSRRAVESAKRADEKETAAGWQMNAALREAEFGNAAQARNETASALGLASSRDVQILAALALARAGDSARAQKMADDLEKQNPVNTLIIGYWLPTTRAAIAINRNNPAKAVELLQTANRYELGGSVPGPEFGGFLYPAYVRGQAYLLLHEGNEAATEFQKFLDHRGVVANCPLGALARLGLARAYIMQGDTAKARSAYNDFFTFWKDADSDIPILQQAQAEYAKLK